jgi:hypothetical protein
MNIAKKETRCGPITVAREHEKLREIFAVLGNSKGFIAGGFARHCVSPPILKSENLPSAYSDVDIFFETISDYAEAVSRIWGTLGLYYEKHYSRLSGVAAGIVKQTICGQEIRWRGMLLNLIEPRRGKKFVTGGRPEDVILDFDFTICGVALLSDSHGIAVPHFREHENARILKFMKLGHPFRMLKRVCKYTAKGYSFDSEATRELFEHYRFMVAEGVIANIEPQYSIDSSGRAFYEEWKEAEIIT